MPNVRQLIAAGSDLTIQNKTKVFSFSVSCLLSARQKQIVMAGGVLNLRSQGN
jgi:hypothetical protein